MPTKIRIAINGFGRIGRHALKVASQKKNIEIVAINDLTDTRTLAHLLKHDTAYPDFEAKVSYDEKNIIIGSKKIVVCAEKDPAMLPWKKLGIDVVIESTGRFTEAEAASAHIKAGAKKVIISAPGKGELKTFVRGVNDMQYKGEKIIDNASCTTNCAAPMMLVLEKEFGIEKAMLTTVHSYTASQMLQDKFDGLSIRVPTITVSLTDLTVLLKKSVTVEQVNKAYTKASKSYLKTILEISNEPLVSSDYIGNAASATIDLELTRVVDGNLVKVVGWYDNEWGYANRLVEMVELVGKKK